MTKENLKPDPEVEKDDDLLEPEDQAKYTDDQVNEIINSKFAKWQADLEKEKAEAIRKAKLTEDEKIVEEKAELERQIEEYKQKELVSANAKIVSNKLVEAKLPHDDAMIDLITSMDEDATNEALNVLINYVSTIKKNNTITPQPNDGGKFKGDDDTLSIADKARKNRIIK